MKFEVLNTNSMPLNKWQTFKLNNFIVNESLFDREELISKGELTIRSKTDYHLINKISIKYHYSSLFEDKYFFADKELKLVEEVDLKTLEIQQKEGLLLPEYFWQDLTCYHNLENHKYQILDKGNNLIHEYKPEFPIQTKCCVAGVLFWNNDTKENNWIECRNPENNQLTWRIDLKWQFVRIEIFAERIVIEYHSYENFRTDKGFEGERDRFHPNGFTIAYDINDGKEVWRHDFVFSQIDKEHQVVLAGDSNIYEVDLNSGFLLNVVEVNPSYNMGYYPHFIDSTGYYYTIHDGRFGKIHKTSGNIEWEFYLIDPAGAKRSLTDWLVLKNGNLVLRAMPNHKNGDITCVFNPNENNENLNIDR